MENKDENDQAQALSKKFEGHRKVTSDDGWITPAGVFYGCSSDEHDELAKYLLVTKKTNIESAISQHERYWKMEDVQHLSSREIIKVAGYALLSNGILAEQNLPDSLTLKQLTLMKNNKLIFAPESGMFSPSVYVEFSKKIKNDPDIPELLEKIIREGLKHEFQAFLKRPSTSFDILQDNGVSRDVFDFLTKGSDAEITMKAGRDIITWRRIKLSSNKEVLVEHYFHKHGEYDEGYHPEEEAFLMLTDKKRVKEFIRKNRRKTRVRVTGDLEILE